MSFPVVLDPFGCGVRGGAAERALCESDAVCRQIGDGGRGLCVNDGLCGIANKGQPVKFYSTADSNGSMVSGVCTHRAWEDRCRSKGPLCK